MKNMILKYGGVAGLIVSLMLLLIGTDIVDIKFGMILGYGSMILAFSTIFLAVKKYRDTELGGFIKFGKAFKIGLYITLVASAIYVIVWMIMSNTIAKDFMADYVQQTIENLKQSNISEAELNERIAQLEHNQEMYNNPIYKIGLTFLEIFPVGLLVSLVAAAILKKK